jgi:NAD(P)-dependent dehydrogenase (short-subunit alcohol dehydrogenase family)
MSTAVSTSPTQREPALLGQTVVVLGGSAGIGLETARLARAEGADVILVGRNPKRLEQAAREVEAQTTAAFDATDVVALEPFFDALPKPGRPRAGDRRRSVLRPAGRDGLRVSAPRGRGASMAAAPARAHRRR